MHFTCFYYNMNCATQNMQDIDFLTFGKQIDYISKIHVQCGMQLY